MMIGVDRRRRLAVGGVGWIIVLMLCAFGGGCDAQPKEQASEDMVGVGITGIDHLDDHLSVQEFAVDGYGAAQAGKGGSTVCCAMLPRQWRAELSVRVDWVEQNWRDCSYRERQRQVPVDRYAGSGRLRVHFLKDDSIRVVVSNVGPRNPAYPGPADPIPRKQPWHEYSPDTHCNREWKQIKE